MKKWLLSSLLLLGGCNFRPHYQYDLIMPCAYRVDTSECHELANVRWWEQFNDPVLDCLIVHALQNNVDLKKAVSRVVEYFAKFGQEGTGLPHVGLLAGVERFHAFEPFPGIGPLTANQYKIFGAVTFELDVWGRLLNKKEVAFDKYLSQIEAKRTVIMTVLSNLAIAYIELRALDEQLLIAQKTWESRVETLNLNKVLHREGYVSKLEIEQSETEVTTALAEVKKYETLIPQRENLISILLGENPGPILRGRPLESLNLPICVPAGLPSELLCRRPDILEAEKNLMASEAYIGQARANLFPRFSLTGLFGRVSNFLSKTTTTGGAGLAYDIAGNVSQVIFDDGEKEYELLEALALNKEAFYEYKGKVLTALREVNDALIAHQKSKELVEVSKKEVAAYKEYYRLADIQYKNGFIDYLNVLYAKNNLFASELRLVARQSDTFKTVIDLYKTLGGGWIWEADSISEQSCF